MTDLPVVARLSRDLRKASTTLSDKEARYLVDAYYQMQDDRIRASLRIKALERENNPEPHEVINWLKDQSEVLENQIKSSLDKYSMSHPVGVWMRNKVKGIGPVIAAGYLSRIDMTLPHMITIGGMWAHCGVAPGKDKRVKGQTITYNPSLKRLTWIVGEQFKRLSSTDKDAFYRHIYDQRKTYENIKNENLDYKPLAEHILATKKFGTDTKAITFYAQGKLPPGHIDARCARYAAKMFLAHLHEVWWRYEFGTEPVRPYPMNILNHVHKINPPGISHG